MPFTVKDQIEKAPSAKSETNFGETPHLQGKKDDDEGISRVVHRYVAATIQFIGSTIVLRLPSSKNELLRWDFKVWPRENGGGCGVIKDRHGDIICLWEAEAEGLHVKRREGWDGGVETIRCPKQLLLVFLQLLVHG